MAFGFGGEIWGGAGAGAASGGHVVAPSPVLAEVRRYWDKLRRPGSLPLRAEVDPRGLAGALPQVFMAERIGPGLARFRVAGMGLADLMGMDVRGMPVSALFEPSARAGLAATLEAAFRSAEAAEMALVADRGIGRPALRARMLVLPLIDRLGRPDLVLGCVDVAGAIGRPPRRFTIDRTTRERLDTADGQPAAAARLSVVAPMADADAPRPAAPVRPALRLVVSNG